MIREYIVKISNEVMEEEIADRPQELIRCKDCKYYPNGDGSTKWLPCIEIITQPGYFCADGKRR